MFKFMLEEIKRDTTNNCIIFMIIVLSLIFIGCAINTAIFYYIFGVYLGMSIALGFVSFLIEVLVTFLIYYFHNLYSKYKEKEKNDMIDNLRFKRIK